MDAGGPALSASRNISELLAFSVFPLNEIYVDRAGDFLRNQRGHHSAAPWLKVRQFARYRDYR
jgi:hypothetical protein